MSPRPLSVDVVSVEDTACLIKVFRQNVLALFGLCPWLQHARVIDRISSLKAKILSKSRSPDAHCERVGLVGHLIRASTACPLGIQSGSDEGFGCLPSFHCTMFHTHSSCWRRGTWHHCSRSERISRDREPGALPDFR